MFRGVCWFGEVSVGLVHSEFNACAAGLSSAVIALNMLCIDHSCMLQGSLMRALAPGELVQEETS